jgi:hypothetical protein
MAEPEVGNGIADRFRLVSSVASCKVHQCLPLPIISLFCCGMLKQQILQFRGSDSP